MEGGGWFSARTQKVSKAHSAIAQPVRRAAARSGAPGGVYGLGRGAQSGVRARESAPGEEAPAGLGGGRLTPAAERLHGEDAPPAQHGPAPGPNAAPGRQQPARDPGQSSPSAVWREVSHARPAPAGRGPRTHPAGGGGEGRAGVRTAGGGVGAPGGAAGGGGWEPGRAGRSGERGEGLDPLSFGLRAAPRSHTGPRSGDLRLRTLSGWRCGVTRHPLTPGSHAGLSSCRRNAAGAEGGGSAGTGR